MKPHQPYRVSGREPPRAETVPRSVAAGFEVAAWAFGAALVTWVVARTIQLSDHSDATFAKVSLLYSTALDLALLVAGLACAWRPIPGTRSHVFARGAVVGAVVAFAAERWVHAVVAVDASGLRVSAMDPSPGMLVAWIGRLTVFVALAAVAFVGGRRFALPRWLPIGAAALGAVLTDVAFEEVLRLGWRASDVLVLLVYRQSSTELAMLLAFAAAFVAVARAARTRPFVDDELALAASPSASRPPLPGEARVLDEWRLAMNAVLAFAFVAACRAAEELRSVVRSLAAWEVRHSIAFTIGVLAFCVSVERARRRSSGARSWALTAGAGLAAFAAIAMLLSGYGHGAYAERFVVLARELGFAFGAFVLGGLALLLPDLAPGTDVTRKVKSALYFAAFTATLSVASRLWATSGAGCGPATFGSRGVGFPVETLALFASATFVMLAIHRARPIDVHVLVARRAARAANADQLAQSSPDVAM